MGQAGAWQGSGGVVAASLSSIKQHKAAVDAAGVTHGPRGPNPAQGARSMSDSGKVFQVAFSQAWAPGQAFCRGRAGEVPADFLKMMKLEHLNPSPRDCLVK